MKTVLEDLLKVPDLTLPQSLAGKSDHAIRLLLSRLELGLQTSTGVPVSRKALTPVVPIVDNYDRLLYPLDAVTRDRRYTHYVDEEHMLRSHTSAHVPSLLKELTVSPREELMVVPGMCYRRDVIDRTHVGTPHQVDLWWVRPGGVPLGEGDLNELIGAVVDTLLPDSTWYTPPSVHPYTLLGREIYVRTPVGDLEIGECGLAHPRLLEKAGLPSSASGLAMGLGLDRLVMLIKGIEDIRLLRSSVPKVKEQMYDLYLYRPVSKNPSAKRDISIALWSPVDVELLGDVVRTSLGDLVDSVEEVEVLSHTPYEDLPVSAHERMGLSPGMSNVLLRLRLSRVDGTMTGEEANALRDRIYSILHVGSRSEYASS